MAEFDRKAFQQSLAKKRGSAGCLFFDANGRLLIVNPTYKKTWEIPGGSIEANESPRTTAMREVLEELSLACSPGRLLCVDYSGESHDRTENFQFIFDGGTLAQAEIEAIRLPVDELSEYRLLPPKKAVKLLNKKLRKRVRHCLRVRSGKSSAIYLEEQVPLNT